VRIRDEGRKGSGGGGGRIFKKRESLGRACQSGYEEFLLAGEKQNDGMVADILRGSGGFLALTKNIKEVSDHLGLLRKHCLRNGPWEATAGG